jgi:hypothetical protein
VLDSRRHRVEQPDYELAVVRKGPNGWFLARKISFSRTDLLPHRQMIYNEQGSVVTDAHYQTYTNYDGTQFPNTIEIEMPLEDYDITLSIVKLELNRPLTNEQFALEQPAGAEVVHLSQPSSNPSKGGQGLAQK